MESQAKASKFYVFYDGPNHKNHEMDITALSIRLRNLGQLLSTVNTTLNGDSPVEVKVKAGFKEGSFGWEVEVFQQLAVHHKDILAYLGFGASVVGATLFEALEKVNGRPVLDIIPGKDGASARILVDGEEIECDEDIAKLVGHPEVRSAVDDLAYEALKDDGTTLFCVKATADASAPLVSVDKASSESFRIGKSTPNVKKADEPFEAKVTFLTGHSDKKTGWRIEYQGLKVPAKIEDEAFLAGIPEGEVPNVLGQKFTVRLRVVRFEGGSVKRRNQYIIEKVFHKSVDHG